MPGGQEENGLAVDLSRAGGRHLLLKLLIQRIKPLILLLQHFVLLPQRRRVVRRLFFCAVPHLPALHRLRILSRLFERLFPKCFGAAQLRGVLGVGSGIGEPSDKVPDGLDDPLRKRRLLPGDPRYLRLICQKISGKVRNDFLNGFFFGEPPSCLCVLILIELDALAEAVLVLAESFTCIRAENMV